MEPSVPLLRPQPALRTRDALALGVSAKQLAGRGWVAPFRGIRLPAGAPLDAPLQRVLAAAELLPAGCAVAGWAAALLLGCTELDGRGPSGTESEPVDLVVPPPRQIRPRPGIRVRRTGLADDDVRLVAGTAVTTVERTAFDLARWSEWREAVAGLDVMARGLGVELGAVAALAEQRSRWRGSRSALLALSYADPRARSRGETRMRLLWRLDAGLPRPQVNATIRTAGGRFLGIVDLLDVETGLVGEYDGAGHRDEQQHAADNAREEDLEDAGLVVVRLGAPDLRGARRAFSARRLIAGHERARRGLGAQPPRWTWQPAADAPGRAR